MTTDYSKKDRKNLLSRLNEKLINCINEKKPVAIHLHTGKVITRITVVPDEIDISEDSFYIVYKSFYLDVKHGADHIEYVDDYEFESYYVRVDTTEIFFDFI